MTEAVVTTVLTETPVTPAAVVGDTTPKVGEVKPADGTPAVVVKPEDKPAVVDAGAKDGTPKETPKTPEPVVFDLKSPEGVAIDAESVKGFTSVAKEVGVTPEQAQKLLDWYGNTSKEKYAAQAQVWENTNKEWVNSAKADKEFGGEKFGVSLLHAKNAMTKFGGPKFAEALNVTGMGNHPEMIRFLVNVAQGFREDKPVDGKLTGDKPTDIAKLLFPNQN